MGFRKALRKALQRGWKSVFRKKEQIDDAKMSEMTVNNGKKMQGRIYVERKQVVREETTDVDVTDKNPSMSPMFNRLQSVSIYGGNFVQQNTIRSERRGFNILQLRVAAAAFHNSSQRVDPPRCHPDTRVAIQKQIYDWILLDVQTRETWLMWMHGAAGAGKSAIMQSIAELCENEQIPLASFFFSRTDGTRNNMEPLIATLVYQLIQNIPQVQEEILTIIESNPLILDQSIDSQLRKLVIQPLTRLQEEIKRFLVIFIDGLDDCTDRSRQTNLIEALGRISRSLVTPVLFIVASRREPQIEAAFRQRQISSALVTLPLDNSDIQQTSDDIRRFLTDKFEDIKETHLRRHLLPANWPEPAVVEEIIAKSSGQFIYASVVINCVSIPRANPAHQLDIVQGLRLRSQNPFAHLDALYQHIFSQIESLDEVLDILAFVLCTKQTRIVAIEQTLQLSPGELEVRLSDLPAVIQCEPATKHGAKMRFLHASLPDFLLDSSRSEAYYIDVDKYRTKLLCMFLERPPQTLDPFSPVHNLDDVSDREYWRLYAIWTLVDGGAKASDRVHHAFLKFDVTFYNADTVILNSWPCIAILQCLQNLDFRDGGQVYRHVLEAIAKGFAKHWALLEGDSRRKVLGTYRSDDLLERINQIYRK